MTTLDATLNFLKIVISLIGVLVITLGVARSVYQLFIFLIHKKLDANLIRLQLGNHVILGLEFMVGADIIGSLVEPNYYNLGLLAILVLIRTVLSYFLNLELLNLNITHKVAKS
jgi:uncharacterized membrane protein